MKRLAYIFCIMGIALFLSGCSKDEPATPEYPEGVKEILATLNGGTFTGEEYFLEQWFRTDHLTFSPFDKPIEKHCGSFGIGDEYKLKYGTVHREEERAVGGQTATDYYFYIDPLWGNLILCEYNFKEGHSTGKRETYDFKVIDSNSIEIEGVVYTRQ